MSTRVWFQVSMSIARDQRLIKAMTLAGESALCLWLFGLAWSRSELTDGVIPAAMLPVIHPLSSKPVAKVADALVAVGLWRKRSDGDYEIAGFLDWNPSKEKVEAKLESDRARKPKRGATAGIPDGIQTEGEPAPGGTPAEKKGKEEERKRGREEISTSAARAGAGAHWSGTTEGNAILAELRAVPALAEVATDATVDALVPYVQGGGKKLEHVLAAIREAGQEATIAAGTPSGPMTDLHLGRLLRKFVANARAPKADPKPGAARTEAQILAEQRRKGVQPGTEIWTGGDGSFTDGGDHAP